ncbi:hypothetical protein LTR70_002427 [Exophiala xenobiotica]|uniref:Stress-response A/B barrel domain-containing protein n=1 Tax=Lithohypha guttulata TaxID=1690604 RepID=A0ABR0KKZ1_9EURO|nr:hypothetical protein LTR24_001424 [Lithohypha guttulata]KAK5325455.1 hypothetical protein LTR70_002427 [Exophiala xenobiotica]
MSQQCIKRTTLFKIPKEEDIPKALEAYKELERTAIKDGKSYILSCDAGKIINTSEPRSQGYTVCGQTTFSTIEDVHYYDNECAAHAKLKSIVTPIRTDAAVMLFESDRPPPPSY